MSDKKEEEPRPLSVKIVEEEKEEEDPSVEELFDTISDPVLSQKEIDEFENGT